MTPEERIEFNEMKAFIESLKDSSSIPFEVDRAFRRRLSSDDIAISTKDVNSEDKAVNEGGAGTYNVLKEPDGFLQKRIGSAMYYIPYYG